MERKGRFIDAVERNKTFLLKTTLRIAAVAVYLNAVNIIDTLPEWVIAEMMLFSGALITASIPDWGEDITINRTLKK